MSRLSGMIATAASVLLVLAFSACEKVASITAPMSSAPDYEGTSKTWDDLELNMKARRGQTATLIGLVENVDVENRQILICRVGAKSAPMHFCGQPSAIIETKESWTPDFLGAIRKAGGCTVFLTVTGSIGIEKTPLGDILKLSSAQLPKATVDYCIQ